MPPHIPLSAEMLIPLLFLLLGYMLYFPFRARKMKAAKIAAKCSATLMCAVVALCGLIATGRDPWVSPLLWAILLCTIGDGLLEVHFLGGMGAFALGHVGLIAWIMQFRGLTQLYGVAGTWIFLMLITMAIFRKMLHRLGKKAIAFVLYAAVLMAMASISLLSGGSRLIGLGGVCFAISDLLVGKGIFDRISPAMDRFALAMYYVSLYCFALSGWQI